MSINEKSIYAQNIARETASELHSIIEVGMSEKDIEVITRDLMTRKGSNSWWYHGISGLVLLGDRTRISMSGRQYVPSETNRVSENDVISIDFSPTFDGYWGDYARTFFMENGKIASEDAPSDPANRKALDAELYLHDYLIERLNPDMTYEHVFEVLNAEIRNLGFVNLDYHGNLGHSVEFDTEEYLRYYLEKGSTKTFREIGKPFTLEPHIALADTGHGYKRENIYYIDGDRFARL